MCNGISFLSANGFRKTLPFTDAADTPKGFDRIPTGGGVYCLSVCHVGESVRGVLSKYRSSGLFRTLGKLNAASEAFFKSVGCGQEWGWGVDDERLARLDRIRFRKNGKLECPILYFGRTKNLQTRMRQLLLLEHTVNHPFWALLNGGWKFSLSYRLVHDEKAAEARLKENYRRAHRDMLPPLMDR